MTRAKHDAPVPISLITLSNLAEAASFHATAAKVLAPFADEASVAHLRNFRTLHNQIGKLLAAADREGRTAA